MTLSPISVSRLHPDPRNANRMDGVTFDKLRRHIQRTGQIPTLIVRPHPQKKRTYMVVDGHHRLAIAKELDLKELPCQVWDLPEDDIALALLTLNQLRGQDIPRRRAELVDSLVAHFSTDDLATLLPETKSELEELLQLVRRDVASIEELTRDIIARDQSQLPVPFGFMVAQEDVPLVNQALARFESSRDKAFVALCREAVESS